MRGMPENSVDSIVTDPPYELSFMGRKWDGSGIAYSVEMWAEALRVLKPGGHLLAFGGTRTYHRMACAIEDAGFEIRDSIHWVYGSGFPKSLNIGKAIDKAAGAEREVVGQGGSTCPGISATGECACSETYGAERSMTSGTVHAPATAPATEEARRWEGWGTALKPAHEPVVVARKPLESTVAGNVLVWGTGGLNIDGCRVGTDGGTYNSREALPSPNGIYGDGLNGGKTLTLNAGRWPANVVFDRTAGEALDQQSGETGTSKLSVGKVTGTTFGSSTPMPDDLTGVLSYGDKGGASRYFTQADFGPDDWPFVYQAKPSRRERNAGLDGLPEKRKVFNGKSDKPGSMQPGSVEDRQTAQPAANHHPTVKPVALMRHLVRLVTPPGGTVLDPFAGSGTTLVAAILERMVPLGCEMTDEYLPIIEGRMAWAHEQVAAAQDAETNPAQPTLL
jgi:site-specific DNA-methyltransferase (adenine-specific)